MVLCGTLWLLLCLCVCDVVIVVSRVVSFVCFVSVVMPWFVYKYGI